MAYKVLIIGCGAIAGGYDAERSPEDWPLSHAGAIARDERFELAACVDPDDAAREAFAKRWGVPLAASDLDSLGAEEGQYDLIVIASPTQFHAEHLQWAHRAWPKAVFCEKPLAHDFKDAKRLSYGFDQTKIPLAINYTRRWQPDLEQLIQEVVSDEWGGLLHAVGTYSKGIVHNGSHMVDLLAMFAGHLQLQSVGPAFADFWEEDPTVSAILTGPCGEPIHLVGGDCEDLSQFELVLTYQFGEIAIRDSGMRIETRRVQDNETFAGYRQLGPPSSVPGRYQEAMTLAYDNLSEILARKAYPKNDNGIVAHAICEEIRQKALQAMKKDPE